MNMHPVPTEKISVVIPVLNEEGNIPHMVRAIHAVLCDWNYEMIFINDGSTDNTVDILMDLKKSHPQLRCVSHRNRSGQSAAIRTGVRMAAGNVIATLDGDGQNPPEEIINLVTRLLQHPDKVALIQGQRKDRKDTYWKKVGSKLANTLRQKVLKDDIRDSGCGLKAFYKDAYLSLAYFDHLHRFMPAMMIREGYGVDVASVTHSERSFGMSKYGNLDRAIVGAWDLMGVMWLIRRRQLSEIEEIVSNENQSTSEILVFEECTRKIS